MMSDSAEYKEEEKGEKAEKKRSRSRSDDDRHKKKKKKKSSRRSHSRSRSRSRSRSQKRKKKKRRSSAPSAWDQAPDPASMAQHIAIQHGARAVPPTAPNAVPASVAIAAAQHAAQLQMEAGDAAAGMAGLAGLGMLGMNPLMMSAAAQRQDQVRRTIFVGNIQTQVDEYMIKKFLDCKLMEVPERPPTPYPDCVREVSIKRDKQYAFVEMHTASDADVAVCMDGINMNGVVLSVRRHSNFVEPEGGSPKYNIPGIISSHVANDGHKIFLGSLAPQLTDQEVMDFVSSFGPLKAFTLVRDAKGLSREYAFFNYVDSSVTDAACKGLNGINLGGREVVCRRANTGGGLEGTDGGTPTTGGGSASAIDGYNLEVLAPTVEVTVPPPPSRIVILHNLCTAAEQAAEFEGIGADVKKECEKLGEVEEVQGRNGRWFVQFHDVHQATQAQRRLMGRRYNNHTIITGFLTEMDWSRKNLDA
eukprot:g20233.t1